MDTITTNVDFTIRLLDDPNYTDLVITDPIEIFKQEIIILLGTTPTEQLGTTIDFDLEGLINNLNVSNAQLKSYIYSSIKKYCAYSNYYDFSVSVTFIKQSITDVALIDILIDDDDISDVEAKTLQFIY